MFVALAFLLVPSVSFAGGYLLRHLISQHRRAEARRWTQNSVDWRPALPANRNELPPPPKRDELGQMLDRWNERARARRSAS